MRNNNKDVIHLLSSRTMKANRTRNLFAVLAITLTTFMICSVFSIGISFAKNFSVFQIRTAGTTANLFLAEPTKEQYEKISSYPFAQNVGLSYSVGAVRARTQDGKEQNIAVACYDKTMWESQILPAVSDVHGSYPQKSGEVFLSQRTLSQLGITNPKTGMSVPLTLTMKDGEHQENFVLSGWYTDFIQSDGGIALVSESFVKDHSLSMEECGRLSLTLPKGKEEEGLDTLHENIVLKDGQKFETSYIANTEQGTMSVVGALGMLILFLIFSGYLLIYNILYISVRHDIRFYGMLKTIGASPKQISRIVRRQAFSLSALGIPLGIFIGALASFVMVPAAMEMFSSSSVSAMPSDVSFEPLIFIGAVVFSFLTVVISSAKPAKMAGRVSPIQALKYTGVTSSSKVKERAGKNGGKPAFMGFRNVFRDKKRSLLVLASLFLGSITFLCVSSFFESMDVENYISRYQKHDFTYTNQPPVTENFDEAFLQEIISLDGVKNAEIIRALPCGFSFDTKEMAPLLKSEYEKYLNPANGDFDAFVDNIKNLSDNKTLSVMVYEMDASYIKAYNKTHEKEIDLEAYQRGDIAIAGYGSYDEMRGNTMTLSDPSSGGEQSVRLGGFFEGPEDFPYAMGGHTVGTFDALFVSPAFMEKINASPVVTDIALDVDPAKEPEVRAKLTALNKTLSDTSYSYTAKYELRESFISSMTSMNVLGGGVSLLLIFIGVLNFINVMMTGVYARRGELAVMESIGMTKKQVCSMLTFEGVYYALITIFLLLTLGSGALALVGKAAVNIADYAVYHYPFALMGLLSLVLFLVCFAVPRIVYRASAKQTVTERLRSLGD